MTNFVKNVIPIDALHVVSLYSKAFQQRQSSQLIDSQLYATALLIAAAATSLFNSLFYFGHFIYFLPALASMNPRKTIDLLKSDLSNIAQSFLFTAFGIYYAVGTLILPKYYFTLPDIHSQLSINQEAKSPEPIIASTECSTSSPSSEGIEPRGVQDDINRAHPSLELHNQPPSEPIRETENTISNPPPHLCAQNTSIANSLNEEIQEISVNEVVEQNSESLHNINAYSESNISNKNSLSIELRAVQDDINRDHASLELYNQLLPEPIRESENPISDPPPHLCAQNTSIANPLNEENQKESVALVSEYLPCQDAASSSYNDVQQPHWPKSDVIDGDIAEEMALQETQAAAVDCAGTQNTGAVQNTVDSEWAKYLEKFCPDIPKDNISKWIEEGRNLRKRFLDGSAHEIPLEKRRELARSFIWYYMYRNVCKNTGFKEGMFVIEDPNYKAADFFSPCASRRWTTHYPGRIIDAPYGIDIENLPAGHRTVHFAKIQGHDPNRQFTFFKPEKFGTESFSQILLHTIDLFKSRYDRWFCALSSDERKEHCPKGLLNDFNQFYQKIRSNVNFSQLFINDYYSESQINLFGIARMRAFLIAVDKTLHEIENVSSSLSNIGYKFTEHLSKASLDDSPERKGKEVIDDLRDSICIPDKYSNLSDIKKHFLFCHIKYATTIFDIQDALSKLQALPPMEWSNAENTIKKTLDSYKTEGCYTEENKKKLFAQVDKDLERNKNEQYLVDGKIFLKADKILDHLRTQGKTEEVALDLLALLQQGVKFELYDDIRNNFLSFHSGLDVQSLNPTPKDESIVSTVKLNDSIIEIEQLYTLKANNLELNTYQDDPYAIIRGFIKIDYKSKSAQYRWEIEKINYGFLVIDIPKENSSCDLTLLEG